ncbi:MAG: methylmalonyl Co-A mutase-associated GTPase MeaB, partial [Chlorobiales bacterium]|nr:methylmalonyl Co-A mutase-associated GTPase MeaB [Chlorobiales bacterium]
DHKIAVLAIDPSSERSKGSILGDKVRMELLSIDPNAFIRPSPNAGSLGGVAQKTRETILLCEAAGFDTIIIETVGVGQSEIAVHSMVDFFLLLMLAGAGDELQGIKRGIMEMADAIAITKADGSNAEKAMAARAEYDHALRLFPQTGSGWQPKVLTCSAITKQGIQDVWDTVLAYTHLMKEKALFEKRRQEQARYWMRETIETGLKDSFYHHPAIKSELKSIEAEVMAGRLTPFEAAEKLMSLYFQSLAGNT